MKPLVLEDIADREKYVGLRPSYRAAIIDYKRSRRLAVGENITLLFEDRETLRFQVQEMVWVEGIALPEKIQHEIDTYNELMPADRELSATLFIEITESSEIRSGGTCCSMDFISPIRRLKNGCRKRMPHTFAASSGNRYIPGYS